LPSITRVHCAKNLQSSKYLYFGKLNNHAFNFNRQKEHMINFDGYSL